MNPTKLPSGTWRLQVYLGKDESGKRIYQSVTHANKRECIRIANDLAQHHHEISRDQSKMTLGEGIDKYIQMKENVLSPSTIRGYRTIRDNRLSSLMDVPMWKISNNMAQEAINAEAKDLSAKTVANVYGLLTATLSQFTTIKLSVTLPQKQQYRPTVLTEAQIRALIVAIKDSSTEVAILLALFLGLRESEIAALDLPKDYNPETRMLTISKALVPNIHNEYVLKPPKSNAGNRVISVPEYLAKKLDHCVQNNIPACSIRPNNLSRSLKRACERAKIPAIRMHDLRHQNASIMLLFAPDKYAMERGGWATNHVMKNVYQHTMSDERIKLEQCMTAYFDSLTSYATQNATRNDENG